MFTTVSTGGFSTRSASIAAFASPALEWTITAFMVLGGTSFILMLEVIRGRPRALLQSTEFIAFISIILSATAAVSAFLVLDPSSESHALADAVRIAAFQVVSILTTTGFATADFNQWLPVSHVILLCLMVIGGCAGSTAGGTKVVRFVTASKIANQQIEKSYRRHVMRPIRVNGKAVPPEDQQSTLVFFMLLALVLISSTLLMALLEPGVSLEGTVSAVAACLFNIGPGLAEVGPTQNFAPFGDLTKLLLAFIMIMGRLELFAILALFSPSLWKS
jgi:trk system potassium uptake protein TrkH